MLNIVLHQFMRNKNGNPVELEIHIKFILGIDKTLTIFIWVCVIQLCIFVI
jgi:hypothetical protein